MTKEWKIKGVEKLAKLMDENSVIGIINMHKMPAPQLQITRKELKDRAVILMAKKSLIQRALEKSKKKDVKKMETYLKGQPTLIFTGMNPFELFRYLKENKISSPAKAGDTAPKDITIEAGDTGIPAGPAIGQLSGVGLISKVQEGKIHIMKDKVVAKEGDIITQEIAGVLGMLHIEPMEIGLDLVATYENGIIFDKKVMDINMEEFMTRLNGCIMAGINVSLNSSYLTKTTAPMAIQMAFMKARTLAVETGIYTKDVMDEILARAHRKAMTLKGAVK